MQRLSFTLTTVTPLLLNGTVGSPDLRAPSFRGMLRYWLRTCLGRENPKNLFEQESKIFGSTDTGSAVQVRVLRGRSLHEADGQRVLPQRFAFSGFEPDGEFRLILTSHPLADKLPDAVFYASALAFNLGAIGKRARRGGGDLQITEVRGVENPLLSALAYLPKDGDDLSRHLRTIIQAVEAGFPAQRWSAVPPYPVLTAEQAQVLLETEAYPTYEDALDRMWRLSGPYHHDGKAFGDVRPRRSSAIHMRVNRSAAGYHPLMTVFRSGTDPNWGRVQQFLDGCTASGFTHIYGIGGWK